MVMFKSNGSLEHISGKFGGVFFRQMKCSNQIVKPPHNIGEEPSPNQKKRQRCFSKCWRIIKKVATVEFVAAWSQYANEHPKTNAKGEQYTMSWAQAFMSYNIRRCVNDLLMEKWPPGYEPTEYL